MFLVLSVRSHCAACGKSTITGIHFPKYTRVNQDVLKTKKKCLDVASAELAAGKSVIIDATNKDAAVCVMCVWRRCQ